MQSKTFRLRAMLPCKARVGLMTVKNEKDLLASLSTPTLYFLRTSLSLTKF